MSFPEIAYDEFTKVELRVGTVIKAEDFPEARNPTMKVWVDFGAEIGVKQTSSQITVHYKPETLIGKQVIGCVNLGTRKVAGFNSEFLLTGFHDSKNAVVLALPEMNVPNGAKLL